MFKPKLGQLVSYTHPFINDGELYIATITSIYDDNIVEITFCDRNWIFKVNCFVLILISDVD